MPADADAQRAVGQALTGSELRMIADNLEANTPPSIIRSALPPARRALVWNLLEEAGLHENRGALLAALRSAEGVHATRRSVTPVWTAPDNLVASGQLTSSIHHYVTRARESVICSTFNFQRSSALWEALSTAAQRVDMKVRVYVDTDAADADPQSWKPTTAEIARELAPAAVFRSQSWNGKQVRSHAKFLAIDHQFLVAMSANFSRSAEHSNVEFGLVVEDSIITQSVEDQMLKLEKDLYTRVR